MIVRRIYPQTFLLLCEVFTSLPFSTFELYQDIIESFFSTVERSVIFLTALLDVIDKNTGDDRNAVLKLVVYSNIPQLMLQGLLHKFINTPELCAITISLLLSISKSTKDVVYEFGQEINLRCNRF